MNHLKSMATSYSKILLGILVAFHLQLDVKCQTTTSVTPSGFKRTVPRAGFNLNSQTKPSWYNTAFLDSARQLNIRLLRYPGGTESQFYNWQTGQSSLSSAPGRQPLAEYVYALDQLNAEGIFCLNMVTASFEDQRAMLLAAEASGVAIRYVELGNELWDDNPSLNYASRFATPQAYADTAAAWISLLRQDFPSAQFALLSAPEDPLTPGGSTSPERVRTWNDGIAGQVNAAEAITFHYYFPLAGVSSSNPDLTQILGKPFELWPRYKQYSLEQLPAGKPVWVTEYNLNDGDQTNFIIASSWAHGLFTSSILFQLLAESQVEMILCHQLFGPPTWGSLRAFFTQPPDTTDLALTAQGAALALIHTAIDESVEAEPLLFATNPTQVSGSTQYPSLVGWSFSGGDSNYVVILNLSPTAFLVSNAIVGASYQYQILSHPNPLQTGLSKQDLTIQTGTQSGDLTLGSYSLACLKAPSTVTANATGSQSLVARVWPNPASDRIRIQLSEFGPFDVKVLGSAGQTIYVASHTGESVELDTSSWVPGVYFLQLSKAGRSSVHRVVKQ